MSPDYFVSLKTVFSFKECVFFFLNYFDTYYLLYTQNETGNLLAKLTRKRTEDEDLGKSSLILLMNSYSLWYVHRQLFLMFF